MSGALEQAVLEALDGVQDPCSIATRRPLSIVEMGLIHALDVTDEGDVRLVLRATSPSCVLIASILEAADERIRAVYGVRAVRAEVDASADWEPDLMSAGGKAKLAAARAHDRRELMARRPAVGSFAEALVVDRPVGGAHAARS
jgi:metal-sulfur cluster biosynthetic enzyme